MGLSRAHFERWLRGYGAAWEARDGEAAKVLFTDDARYHWTPFRAPQRGPDEIAAAWNEATSNQEGVRFHYEIVAIDGAVGVARWRTRFVRAGAGHDVEVDGVLTAELDSEGRCRVFREWWHTTER